MLYLPLAPLFGGGRVTMDPRATLAYPPVMRPTDRAAPQSAHVSTLRSPATRDAVGRFRSCASKCVRLNANNLQNILGYVSDSYP